MASRRVRQVGRVRWVRLETGERVSQCGAYFVQRTRKNRWRLHFRQQPAPHGRAPMWRLTLYTGRRLRDTLQAAAIFDAARTAVRPSRAVRSDVAEGWLSERVAAWMRAQLAAGVDAIAAAEGLHDAA